MSCSTNAHAHAPNRRSLGMTASSLWIALRPSWSSNQRPSSLGWCWTISCLEIIVDWASLDHQVISNQQVHLCFHAIHEPHPAMPAFYHQYAKDPDYLGPLFRSAFNSIEYFRNVDSVRRAAGSPAFHLGEGVLFSNIWSSLPFLNVFIWFIRFIAEYCLHDIRLF